MSNDASAMVLVADDDPIFRSLVTARLSKLNGRAVEACDGSEAWDILLAQTFDLAIVDLSMPGLDGFSLIQCMRSYPRTRHMPIVVITSQDDVAVIERALTAGATSFMTKPVNWTTFEHHLGFLLRLAEGDRRSRTALQLSNVVQRVNGAVLHRLCQEVADASVLVRSSLSSAALGEASREQLGEAERAVEGIAAIAAKSQHISELLSQGIRAADDPVLLEGILSSACAGIAPAADTANITIDKAFQGNGFMIRGDASSIELALAELLHNAVTHSPQGSRISVSVRGYPDGLVAIDITDNGPGMHPEFVTRILSPMIGGDECYDRYESVGCGLLLAKTVAEVHGGSLEVRTLPGQGTTILFLVPPERVMTAAKLH